MRRTDLEQIVQACRELAITMIPSPSPAPPAIRDDDAEAVLLASIGDGFHPSQPVDPADYYAVLHRSIGEVLDVARGAGVTPTVRVVLCGLDELGVRGAHLETSVRRIFEETPVAVRPDEVADRVRSFAWRRRMALRLDCLRALLLEPAVSDGELERELDAFVELGAAQPCRSEAP